MKQISEIRETVNRRAREYGAERVYLFGSYARGDYNDSSDIDIMILTDLNDDEIFKYRNKIWEYAYDIEWDNNFDIKLSPLIKNIDKFNYWLEALPFYMNVQKEGVVLNWAQEYRKN